LSICITGFIQIFKFYGRHHDLVKEKLFIVNICYIPTIQNREME